MTDGGRAVVTATTTALPVSGTRTSPRADAVPNSA
jgi:hypothetical protein